MKNSVAVIGAGPAGLCAAIAAAKKGCAVAVFEKMPRPGLKLLASGGGRCNISNLAKIEDFIAAYGRHGRFAQPALSFFSPCDTIQFFKELGVDIVSPDGFLLYPASGKSSDVLDALLREAKRFGVKIATSAEVKKITAQDGRFESLNVGEDELRFEKILLSNGGAGYPSLGGGLSGYKLAESIGHRVVKPLPGLCEIRIVNPDFPGISGVTISNASISLRYGKEKFDSKGEILFTHKGLSGPAALNASGRINRALCELRELEISLSLDHRISREEWIKIFTTWRKFQGARKIYNLVATKFPHSLAKLLCGLAGVEERIAAELRKDEASKLAETLSACRITPSREYSFQKAMVTVGGVALEQIDPKSMSSKICKGVFFAGELLDIDGPCGGYNLQWAISSGYLAGTKMAESK